MLNKKPLISFTFDDFPRSALEVGGRILSGYGVRGTYYVSLGLLDREEVVGRICSRADLARAVADGHELGCHTFGHCDAWETDPDVFEDAIQQNKRALETILPAVRFETMSYPISTTPRPKTKRQTGREFLCCRAGGQRSNVGTVDLNYVYAYFLERSMGQLDVIHALIERNSRDRGWLIFATHDVADPPTQFGCTPAFFEDVVRRAVASGAAVLPVRRALAAVLGDESLSPA
jgi:peptidoglycan/xylan/chitin deacetylase (PgdA/CDA1 family)